MKLKNISGSLNRLQRLALLLVAAVTLSACAKPNLKWTEDVLLGDGKQITVTRERLGNKAFGGIGDAGGWEAKANTISFPNEIPTRRACCQPISFRWC